MFLGPRPQHHYARHHDRGENPRDLLNAAHTERGFVQMVPRMLLAYTSGALRYGLVVAHRGPESRSSGP
ncbi:MAG: hypothetical protein ACLFRB_11615 [Thiohalorhabdus sp.]|uniref:hypothetical protein n=1 Tax=Thiohalorhabdus sp. TaxID=3094134 RepID=UPI0039806CDE